MHLVAEVIDCFAPHAGDNIEPPSVSTIAGIDVITYTWTHPRNSSVDYYSLVVGGDMLDNQTVHLNKTEFELPSNLKLFELRAISKCGQHSAPQFVYGNTHAK